MALTTFELEHGLSSQVVGEEGTTLLNREVGLRELTTADLIDAEVDAEKIVVHGDKAVPYTSPVLHGLHLLRRQVAYIGQIPGPLSMSQLRRLHPDDLAMIQTKADELDKALMEEVAKRGRAKSAD